MSDESSTDFYTLAAVSIALIRLISIAHLESILSIEFFGLVAQLNLALFMFNLLPFPPLDGFQLLSELFPALKILNEEPLSIFALTVLLLSPDYGSMLSGAAHLVAEVLSGASLMSF